MLLFQVKLELSKNTALGKKQDFVRFNSLVLIYACKDFEEPNRPGGITISLDLVQLCNNWVVGNSKSHDGEVYTIDRKKFDVRNPGGKTLRAEVGEKDWSSVKKLVEIGIKWGKEKSHSEQRQKPPPKQKEKKAPANEYDPNTKYTANDTEFFQKTA